LKFRDISYNSNITLQNILDHKELPWDYSRISSNLNITLQNILDHPELPWNFSQLSSNPNITFQNVVDHPEINWNYNILSSNFNIFRVSDLEYFIYIKKHIAINRIKRQWLQTIYNPIYKICKKRLLKEFYKLENYNQVVFTHEAQAPIFLEKNLPATILNA
jgi:hypothetical protein